MNPPRAAVSFSSEKYSRHHAPDPSSANLLNRINIADDDLRHLLYLSPLTREKAGPTPEREITEVRDDLCSISLSLLPGRDDKFISAVLPDHFVAVSS